jgi:hypothetical protein
VKNGTWIEQEDGTKVAGIRHPEYGTVVEVEPRVVKGTPTKKAPKRKRAKPAKDEE